MSIIIVNKAFATGSLEQTYKIPARASSVAFHALTGDIAVRTVTGTDADHWTILEGGKESINDPNLVGSTLYFTGDDGDALEIRVITGLMC